MNPKLKIFSITLILIIALFIIPSIHSTNLNTDLISYYKLDENSGTTVIDATGSINVSNIGATINQTGKIGKAYSFDGSNDYISLDTNSYVSIAGDLSIFMWIKVTSFPSTGDSYLISDWSTPYRNYVLRLTSANKLSVLNGNGLTSQDTEILSTGTLSTDTWYFVGFIRDTVNNTVKIYIDSASKSAAINYDGNSTTNALNIGANYLGNTANYNGIIDEVGVWSRALTSTEVSDLYNSGDGLTYPFPTYIVSLSNPTGTYYNNFDLNLTTPMADANIYYTNNGTTPDNTDNLYSTPFSISSSQTIKAVAYDGTDYTDVATATYTMQVAGTPTANVDTNTYYNNFNVTLTKDDTNTTGSTLRYTTNGDDPTIASSLYTTPVSINGTTTFKFAQFKTGYTPTAITTKTYTMVVTNPVITETTGTYNNSFTTTITNPTTTGTSIYYTIDGSVPDNTDTLYTGAITINTTQTLKAIAYKSGYTISGVDTETYTMQVAGTPTSNVNTGSYSVPQNVTLTKAGTTTGTTMTYTTNGDAPTIASTEYTTPILINSTTTLKFAEFKTGYTAGTIETKTYTITISDPTANVDTGTYNNNFNSILTQTDSQSIYYTTNGSVPDNTDTLYTTPIAISGTTTLKFIAYNGAIYSNVITKTYTMAIVGTPTADKISGLYYDPISVTLTKAGTTTGTTLTYTTNGSSPTITSTLYTTPILISSNTTLKFAEFKTGYTAGAIETKTYEVRDPYIHIQFYDENSGLKLDDKINIIDTTNGITYNPNATGLWEENLRDIDWNGQYINATINRTVAGTTTHTSRNLQFYWDNQADHDLNFSLLPVELGEEVEFLAKDTNGNFWTSKFVQFVKDGNILSSNLTDSGGNFTSYILTTGDYNAVFYGSTGTEFDTYIKTTVTVIKPKNEKSLALISPYDIEVGGLLLYSVTNTTDANKTVNIFGGTTSTYDFTLVDYNADPVDRVYIPRTYNLRNPWGLGYNPTYTLESYLVTKEDGVIPSIVVYDELKRPYPDITVSIFKQIEGNMKLVEQKVTDSTGRTSFSGFPLDTYYIYLYENGTLKGSYNIQVRDTGETFYFVIDRTATNDIIYRGLDLKYNWNNTPDYIQLSTQDLDINLNVYGYYLNDFNITGYTINTYQNNALIETATDVLTGTNVTITETFNKSNYTVAKPIVVIANVTFTYNGEIRTLQIKKSVATGTSESGLLMVLKNFPEKVGYIWTILLSILITISVIVLVGTSGFIDRNYLLYLGLFVLGIFVFIGWFAVGVEVLGIDVMWFMYIITIVAAVGFAVKDEQR